MSVEKSEITVPVGTILLKGNLNIPESPNSLVIFSHGSGSSRFSSRNAYVAEQLNKERIATLLTDLLTEEEDQIYVNRFDIPLITKRLVHITEHMRKLQRTKYLPIGYFGASTGAASALMAAAQLGNVIGAVVSRGGRPDLAKESLTEVNTPTLLIVGSLDDMVIELNQRAYDTLRCEKELKIIQGAGHLFEEPGKLDNVADLAATWFSKHLHPILIK